MGTDAGFHPDQARWHVGKPRLQLPARPLLPQHDRAVLILANDVERVLTDVDANHASDCTVVLAGHGVLLVFAAPCPASLAGRAGARPDHSISSRSACPARARSSALTERPAPAFSIVTQASQQHSCERLPVCFLMVKVPMSDRARLPGPCAYHSRHSAQKDFGGC